MAKKMSFIPKLKVISVWHLQFLPFNRQLNWLLGMEGYDVENRKYEPFQIMCFFPPDSSNPISPSTHILH